MRALIIDPARQSLREGDMDTNLDSLQEAVGGSIELAYEFANGDVLYVNEDGISRAEEALQGKETPEWAFWFEIGAHQPFAGRGLVVGAEDEHGQHGPAKSSLEEIASVLYFLAPKEFAAPPGTRLQ